MYSAVPGAPQWPPHASYGQSHTQSAYIPVPARHTFSSLPPPPTYDPVPLSSHAIPPPPPQAQSQVAMSAPSKKKTEWSPAVRDYVSRSFAQENAIPEVARADIEVRLRQIITNAASSDQLESTNWTLLPLPQHMILQDRQRAALAPLPFPPFTAPAPPAVGNPNQLPADTTLRKRKSSELTGGAEDGLHAPWKNGNKPPSSLADRISFAPAEKRLKMEDSKPYSKSQGGLNEQRRKRFEDARIASNSPSTPKTPRALSPHPVPTGPIVGRSQKLEKNYFRLTSAPNPDDVRPLEVLRKTLELLKKKWRSDNNYVYICDQFKSLRQDLTVQHIKNDFTTTVYEIHARIALEKGDLGEYNQCQSQLRALYKQNLGGHPVEFKAYRILYFIHTCNRTDMNDVLSDLTPADKQEDAVKHALDVRSALALGNYHKFFKLYLAVPNMGAYLMDMFVERERLVALSCMCRS